MGLAMLLAASPTTAQNDGAPPPSAGPTGTSQAVPGAERYDAVGYADLYPGESRPEAATAAHDSLPAGSFAEVTALDSGKTIIVMIVDHGIAPGRIVALSEGAIGALGAYQATVLGVRVRRVNPLGTDQQALRDGRLAAPRIDAPPVLLTALRKRLSGPPARLAMRQAAPATGASYTPPRRDVTRPPVRGTVASSAGQGFFVQVAALSNAARAAQLAEELGGSVQPIGSIYRVRLGPFADPDAANRARDGVARRGYAGAQIIKP